MAVNDIVMGAAGASGPATYIEDVFSTWLYTGTGSPQTITNGIDLSTKGGLVWVKTRGSNEGHGFFDTNRGVGKFLRSNTTGAEITDNLSLTSFNSNGFSAGTDANNGIINYPWGSGGDKYASWTFRKQPKFFDVVTGTADSSGNVSFNHSLGSVPGFVIIKSTTNASDWYCYHRSLGDNYYIRLNLTNAAGTYSGFAYTPTDTTFSATIGFGAGAVGYVAYLFAHNAGGFGLSGTDNVISCGSFTTDGSGDGSINLGYEPQWLLVKDSTGTGGWYLLDNMRGLPGGSFTDALLSANLSAAEADTNVAKINATGASFTNYGSSRTIIYIAIRRPMKTPTTGTEVFSPISSSSSTGTVLTTNFPVDTQIIGVQQIGFNKFISDRLRGVNTIASNNSPFLDSTSALAEVSSTNYTLNWNNTGFQMPGYYGGGILSVFWNFRRAAGFFDVVCYTGDATGNRKVNHNLTVAPELLIVKKRSSSTFGGWYCYVASLGATKSIVLNTSDASNTNGYLWNDTAPTTTQFTVQSNYVNSSGDTFVAYLFATVANVSKVGSYTGNGSSQTINCSFTTGARFVMIKRTDSTGDWWVWDSARGMVAGTDPRLALNTTDAQINADWVYTASSGFQIVTTDASVNASGGSYLYFAVA